MKLKFTPRLKIKPTVITLFILTSLVLSNSILALQYHFSQEMALEGASRTFQNVNSILEEKIASFDNQGQDIVRIIREIEASGIRPAERSKHPLLELFTTILSKSDFLYALYIGYVDGSFFEVINLNIDKDLRKKYNASQEERWLVVKIFEKNDERFRINEFLNKDLIVVREEKKKAVYDPRKRPWYKDAKQTKEVIKTTPYQFSNIDQRGITYAQMSFLESYVVGLDVSLKSLSSYMKSNASGFHEEIFLFMENGEVIASNNKDGNQSTSFSYVFEQSKIANDIGSTVKIEGKKHFIFTSAVPSAYGEREYLGVAVPLGVIMAPYYEKIYYSIYVTVFILTFIAIPLIYYSGNLISRPIHKIALENEKIRRRDFDSVNKVETHIQEISELSDSLFSLSCDIKAYEEAQRKLMDAFIELIANAIDAKSAYTGRHCERVPVLTLMLAEEASKSDEEPFRSFCFKNNEERHELNVAAWLHDCGKITMPEYIVDKATKLETIYNRIHEVRMRFEVLYRDAIIKAKEMELEGVSKAEAEQWLSQQYASLEEEFAFVAQSNIGGEFMGDEAKAKIQAIAKHQWIRYFDKTLGLSKEEEARLQASDRKTSVPEALLDDKPEHIIQRKRSEREEYDALGFKTTPPEHLYNLGEIYNLTISRGTLSEEDRFKINEHMMMTIKMLEKLPFPDGLKKVPEYAGAHHETMIGTGYPRQLTGEQMSIPARIMAIADIFEALTASDRPYKKAKTLSESIKILSFMAKDGHIDRDLFKLFLTSGVYLKYAHQHLKAEQIDSIEITEFF